jgi:predicted molibdopterin-dependent oxidoreductase YjgC
LCVKGRYGWPYVVSADRLTKPLIRKDGTLQEVEWDEALRFVAQGLRKIKETSGGASLAGLGSERLTNEEAYVFNRFVRTVMESPHIDHAAGYGYRALVDGLGKSLGYPASTNSIREIRNSKVILLLGSDLTETHPVAKNEVIIATSRHRAKAIVVDSIRTKLTDRPGLFLLIPPGTEHLIANAMLKHIIDQELFDKSAVGAKAEGLEELIASLAEYTPENVSQITGVEVELIREAATEYANAPTATIILTEGLNKVGNNVETAVAAVNLALVTGRIGKEACGVHVFGEKVNSQGAIDMGLAPDLLPGFAPITDEATRAKFEAAWKSPLPKETGLSAAEVLAKAEQGDIKGLYVVAENPVDSYPDRALTEKALAKLDFLVVQDMFLSSTAKMAHAVLPVAFFTEKTGTFTSAERLVQRIQPVLDSRFEKTDLDVFIDLASFMGKPMNYQSPEKVMDEIAGLVKVYEGISHERLKASGLQWPCVDAEDPGKKILYEGGFPGGKAMLAPAVPLQKPDLNGLPMYLIPGVVKFHSGSLSSWSPSLMDVCPAPYAEMSRNDIKSLGLKEGDLVKITDASGSSVQTPVKFSRRAMDGMVVVPFHFPGLKLNNLTRWDKPVVKVKVEKA